jgi:integrase
MHPRLITRRMDRLITRAGILPGEGKKISPVHSWRHTTGTMLYRAFKGDARDNDHRKHLAHKISSARDRVNFGPL